MCVCVCVCPSTTTKPFQSLLQTVPTQPIIANTDYSTNLEHVEQAVKLGSFLFPRSPLPTGLGFLPLCTGLSPGPLHDLFEVFQRRGFSLRFSDNSPVVSDRGMPDDRDRN